MRQFGTATVEWLWGEAAAGGFPLDDGGATYARQPDLPGQPGCFTGSFRSAPGASAAWSLHAAGRCRKARGEHIGWSDRRGWRTFIGAKHRSRLARLFRGRKARQFRYP